MIQEIDVFTASSSISCIISRLLSVDAAGGATTMSGIFSVATATFFSSFSSFLSSSINKDVRRFLGGRTSATDSPTSSGPHPLNLRLFLDGVKHCASPLVNNLDFVGVEGLLDPLNRFDLVLAIDNSSVVTSTLLVLM